MVKPASTLLKNSLKIKGKMDLGEIAGMGRDFVRPQRFWKPLRSVPTNNKVVTLGVNSLDHLCIATIFDWCWVSQWLNYSIISKIGDVVSVWTKTLKIQSMLPWMCQALYCELVNFGDVAQLCEFLVFVEKCLARLFSFKHLLPCITNTNRAFRKIRKCPVFINRA